MWHGAAHLILAACRVGALIWLAALLASLLGWAVWGIAYVFGRFRRGTAEGQDPVWLAAVKGE